MMIGSAMMANTRRIQRYLEAKEKLEIKHLRSINEQECSHERPLVSFFASIKAVFHFQMTPITFQFGGFGY
jgi:rubrerythrin